jgi:hypothetical protein
MYTTVRRQMQCYYHCALKMAAEYVSGTQMLRATILKKLAVMKVTLIVKIKYTRMANKS